MAMTGLLVGSALGLAKTELIDQPAADRKRKYEAATAAYSPWTGMKSQFVQDPNALGSVAQFGGGGAALGSAIHSMSANANLDNAAAGTLNGSSDPSVNSLGGQDMSAKLGNQASNFDKSMSDQGNWFFGPTGGAQAYSQPSFGNPVNPGWASLQKAGISPDAPNNLWTFNRTNPYAGD